MRRSLPVRWSIFLLTLIVAVVRPITGQGCDGSLSFEKTSASKLDPQQAQTHVLISQPGHVILPDCINLCRDSETCTVFNNEYSLGQCVSVSISDVRKELAKSSQSSSIFQKVCFENVDDFNAKCGDRMWAFERVLGASLRGFNDLEMSNTMSRVDCERLCLMEESFTCRSAEYDSLTNLCTLSREDRRSQPSAFVQGGGNGEYLENQCIPTSTSLYGCLYKSRRDIAIVSKDGARPATSESECQSFCFQSAFYLCRSYTYLSDQRICYLSSDDTLSFPWTEPKLGAYYGQLRCTINQCTAGIITFEKVTGFTLLSARQELLGTVSSNDKISNCLSQCRAVGSTCPAVLVDYIRSACYRLDRNSQGRDDDLVASKEPGWSYFEQVCLQGKTQTCNNKLWSFERVPNHEIRGFDDITLNFIQSRRECEEACLQETEFVCRSAEYDYDNIRCTLSRKDRRINSAYFVPTTRKVDYLENQCVEVASEDGGAGNGQEEVCEFVAMQDGFPRYTDAIVTEVSDLESCKNECSSQMTFTCRSLGFRSSSRECYLSGDDSISGGGDDRKSALVPSQGINYFERQCDIPPEVFTPEQPPITHPFPFTPPTQEPLPGPDQNPPGRCVGNIGRTEYEKTTGYKVSQKLNTLYEGGLKLGITVDCQIKCNADPSCQGIVLDYGNNRCYSLRNDPAINRDMLIRAQSTAYFEPVCYQVASGCGRLWSFERFLQKQLKVDSAKEVVPGVSRQDCQQRCLVSTVFVCRSFNYDVIRQECHLNSEDRATLPNRLIDATAFDYFENQCYQFKQTSRSNFSLPVRSNDPRSIHQSRVTTMTTMSYAVALEPKRSLRKIKRQVNVCRFTNMESSSRLSYIERGTDVNTETECQMACEKEFLFNCKSYSFAQLDYQSGAKCYLSADTRNSVGAELRTQARSTYAERVCDPNYIPPPVTSTTSRPYPTLPPKPYFPKPPLPPPPYYPPGKPDFGSYPPPPPPPPPQSFYPSQPYPPPPQPHYPYSYGDGPNPYYPPHPYSQYPPPPLHPPHPIGQERTSLDEYPSGSQLFPLPGSSAFPNTPAACYADVTFERITKLANQGFGSDIRISLLQQPSLDCLQECLVFGDQCHSITFKSSSQCTLFGVPAGGTILPPVMAPDSTYFKKICLPGANCDKAWAFDRVPFYFLDGHDDLELQNYNTREACEMACLRQTSFPCRSADYFYSKSVCRLSRETRRSQPYSFQYYGDGVEYLENQCQPEPGFCGFLDFPEKHLAYFDRRIFGALNQFDCQTNCAKERAFICRSTTYDLQTNECFLSSCDRFCAFEIIHRTGSVYSERITCGHDLHSPALHPPPPPQMPSSSVLRQFPASQSFYSEPSNTQEAKKVYDQMNRNCGPLMKWSFERTVGYAPLTAHHQLIPTWRMRGASETCVQRCLEMDGDCSSFVLAYSASPTQAECLVYGPNPEYKESVPETDKLQNKADVAFFEKICLRDPGFPCDKHWLFDRMFGYEFSNGYFMTYESVTSRRECEDLCLRYIHFPCRSASYSFYMRTCRLNVESRQTLMASFQYVGGDVQYLENQCTI